MELPSGERVWGYVPGSALMSVVGWPHGTVAQPENDKLLYSFAGNAFSAFSIGSVYLGMFVAMAAAPAAGIEPTGTD